MPAAILSDCGSPRPPTNGELARSGDSVPAEIQQAALSALVATGEGTDRPRKSVGDFGGRAHCRPPNIAEPISDPARKRPSSRLGPSRVRVRSGGPGIVTFRAVHAFRAAHRGARIALVMPMDTVAVAKAGARLDHRDAARADAGLRRRAQARVGRAAGRGAPPMQVLMPQTDIAPPSSTGGPRRKKRVPRGRISRRKTRGWIFQLRMAELERAKDRNGNEARPRPWNRLGRADCSITAFWGIVLASAAVRAAQGRNRPRDGPTTGSRIR